MSQFMWRWKLSREVDPLAHLYTGRTMPPFVSVDTCDRVAVLEGLVCKQTCWLCAFQISLIFSLSNSGTPRVSQPFSPSNDSNRFEISTVPRVARLQWSAICWKWSSSSHHRLVGVECFVESSLLALLSSGVESLPHPTWRCTGSVSHEYTVKLMLICSASIGKTTHEVPDIQPENHHKLDFKNFCNKTKLIFLKLNTHHFVQIKNKSVFVLASQCYLL
jgi:hypothetical protein